MIAMSGLGVSTGYSTSGSAAMRASAPDAGAFRGSSSTPTSRVPASPFPTGATDYHPGSAESGAYWNPPPGAGVALAPSQSGTLVASAGAGSTAAAPPTVAAGDCASAA